MLDAKAKQALRRLHGLTYALNVKANHFEFHPDKKMAKLLYDMKTILRQAENETLELEAFLKR